MSKDLSSWITVGACSVVDFQTWELTDKPAQVWFVNNWFTDEVVVDFPQDRLPSPSKEDCERRLEALKAGCTQWGCDGYSPLLVGMCFTRLENCVVVGAQLAVSDSRIRVSRAGKIHYHDAFCRYPVRLEMALAGVEEPERGWGRR